MTSTLKSPIYIFLLLIFSISKVVGQDYVQFVAKNGDNIIKTLYKYDIKDDDDKSYKAFIKINKLGAKRFLIIGKKYNLPIQKVDYTNGSIKKTLDLSDFKLPLKIKQYNEKMLQKKLRKTSFVEDKTLWVPLYLYDRKLASSKIKDTKRIEKKDPLEEAEVMDFKPSKGDRIYPIFGPKHEHVPLKDRSLANKVFYIVSGHGGPDPGAMAIINKNVVSEDEYAYDVSLRLCRELISRGAIAYMIIRDNNDGIRDEKYLVTDRDEVAWGNKQIPLDQVKRLKQRANIVNKLYTENKKKGLEQKLVVIHVDSRSKTKKTDVFFYYNKDSAPGKKLANNLRETFVAKYKKYRASGEYEGKIIPRNLYMLRETFPTTVFIELANIQNKHDQKRIIIKENRQYLAEWIYEGIVK